MRLPQNRQALVIHEQRLHYYEAASAPGEHSPASTAH